MASFNFPFHITKNTPAVANETQTNFDDLLAWILDNLIQADGSVVMTGPLVLAPGDPASPGHAANKAYVDAIIPVGTIWEYGGTSLPSDWLWCNGDTYTDGSQPRLAGAIGRNFTALAVPPGSFQVPDKRQRVSVGVDATDPAFAIGKTGGQRNWENIQHLHVIPVHGHAATSTGTANHDHPFGTSGPSGEHHHDMNIVGNPGSNLGAPSGYGPGTVGTLSTSPARGDAHTHSGTTAPAGGWTPTITVADKPAFNTENNGTVTNLTDKNLPPYLTVNYIIYAGPS